MKFQLWCHEEHREGSWPPVENAHKKHKRPKDQSDGEREDENDDENDDESDDESDDEDYWLPEQYQVASVHLPTEATLRRPIAFLIFKAPRARISSRTNDERHYERYVIGKENSKAEPFAGSSYENHRRKQKNASYEVVA